MARLWFIADALVILIFVAIGRSAHHHGVTLAGMASTTWPFGVGLVVGWLVVARRSRSGATLTAGVTIWLCAVVFGMVLRVVSGQGIAPAFIVVALAFLGATMLGLRFLALVYRRRRAKRVV